MPIKDLTHRRLFSRFNAMHQRCENPRNRSYKNYGGRGITVCERWNNFENFLSDMGPGKPGWSLERVDNDKGYCPENCCWATAKQQGLNTRFTRRFTVRGVTGCVWDLCIKFKANYGTVCARLQSGRDIESAMFGPRCQIPRCQIPAITKEKLYPEAYRIDANGVEWPLLFWSR